MSDLVSNCCGAEVIGDSLCYLCGEICDSVSKEQWLHQKIDSLQGELREMKAKVATLEGETRTMQKFIRS